MRRVLLALSLVFFLSGCLFIKPISFSNTTAGRFVRVDLKSPGRHDISVMFNGELIENISLSQDQDHFYFFAKNPGVYDVIVDDEKFSVRVSPPEWQVFIWMAADNNLRDYASEDIAEISDYGIRTSVLVFFDGVRDEVLAMSDEGLRVLKTVDINSGSGKELRDFINEFSIDLSKKFLVIWDHGSSWLGDSNYKNDFTTRAVALDEESKDALTIPELSEALDGLKFDLLGFDACFMGSVEVIYQLRRVARYIIASGDYEPGSGWDYSFLKDLNGSSIEVAKSVLDRYSDYIESFSEYLESDHRWSLSIFNTTKVDELASKFKDFTNEISTPAVRNLAYELENEDPYKRYIKNVEEVLKAYTDPKPILGDVIVYYWTNGGYPMNILLPNPGELGEIYDSYYDLEFASDTGWLEYLKEAGL